MKTENERFKDLRKKSGMTQEQFAEKISLGLETVRKAEQGNKISIESSIALCKALGVSLDYIYGLTEDDSDMAGTMLLYLKKFFHYRYDGKSEFPHTVDVAAPVLDFLKSLDQAYKALERGMPQAAYDIWVKQIKEEFNESIGRDTECEEYKMISSHDVKILKAEASRIPAPGTGFSEPPGGY